MASMVHCIIDKTRCVRLTINNQRLCMTFLEPTGECTRPPAESEIALSEIVGVRILGSRRLVLLFRSAPPMKIKFTYKRQAEKDTAMAWFRRHLIDCREHERVDWAAGEAGGREETLWTVLFGFAYNSTRSRCRLARRLFPEEYRLGEPLAPRATTLPRVHPTTPTKLFRRRLLAGPEMSLARADDTDGDSRSF